MTYKQLMKSVFDKDRILSLKARLKDWGPVEVKHMDGSIFKIKNGLTEIIDKWLVVYCEHMHPLVFFKEDLEKYGKVKNNGGVVQLEERRPLEPDVDRSNRSVPAIILGCRPMVGQQTLNLSVRGSSPCTPAI